MFKIKHQGKREIVQHLKEKESLDSYNRKKHYEL